MMARFTLCKFLGTVLNPDAGYYEPALVLASEGVTISSGGGGE